MTRLHPSVASTALLVLLTAIPARAQDGPRMVPLDPEYTLYIDVPDGRVVVELTKDFAPMHVDQVRALAREGHYDGFVFHRVIEDFLAQAAEPTWQKVILTARDAVPAEFEQAWSDDLPWIPVAGPDEFGEEAGLVNGFPARRDPASGRVWLTRCPATFGFARANDPDSGRASFWITLVDNRFNDRNDTAFGRVVWGMEHISRLRRTNGQDFENGVPVLAVRVAADLPENERLPLALPDWSDPAIAEWVANAGTQDTEWHVHTPRRYELCHFTRDATWVGGN